MIIEILGLVFSIILGTIGHFLYKWSNYNKIIGFLFSKDEDVWDHLKLGITPIILWTIVEFFTFNFNNLFFAKFFSILAFIVSTVLLYYGYKIITKKNILFLDIMLFYISLAIAYIISMKLIVTNYVGFLINFIGFCGILFFLYLYKKIN